MQNNYCYVIEYCIPSFILKVLIVTCQQGRTQHSESISAPNYFQYTIEGKIVENYPMYMCSEAPSLNPTLAPYSQLKSVMSRSISNVFAILNIEILLNTAAMQITTLNLSNRYLQLFHASTRTKSLQRNKPFEYLIIIRPKQVLNININKTFKNSMRRKELIKHIN